MTPRRLIFWTHLTVGSIAGLVILTMCITGTLLAFQRQILHAAERSYRHAPPPNTRPLSLEALLEKSRADQSSTPSSILWRSNPSEPVEITFNRNQSLLLNPYTGEILGSGATRTRAFFHFVEDAHRWLAFSPENRAVGRAITGACNLGFLFLVCSGPYLWLPRTWTRAAVNAGTRFNPKLAGKARDFNWHNVIGFWCCIPLAAIVLCAVVMSYPWANNLVYRATGNPAPSPNASQQAPGAQPNAPRNRANGSSSPNVASSNSANAASSKNPSAASQWKGFDTARLIAEQRVPGWQTITLRLPAPSDPNLTFSIDSGNGGRPDRRAQLTMNRKAVAEVRWEPFSSYNSGRRLRSWIRFTHTGEAAGLPGQAVAALVATGGAFLVCTGVSLALRRLRAKLTRQAAARAEPSRPVSS